MSKLSQMSNIQEYFVNIFDLTFRNIFYFDELKTLKLLYSFHTIYNIIQSQK